MLLSLVFRKNLRHHITPERSFRETFTVHVFNDNVTLPSQFAIFFHIIGNGDRSLVRCRIIGADNQNGILIFRDSPCPHRHEQPKNTDEQVSYISRHNCVVLICDLFYFACKYNKTCRV